MEKRPRPIVVLAVVNLLAPLAVTLGHSWAFGIHPIEFLTVLNPQGSLYNWIHLLLPMPVAGLALLCFRRWSYPVFFGLHFWAVYCNLLLAKQVPGQTYPWLLHAATLATLGFLPYLLDPAIQTVFNNPRLRWWEVKPRYMIKTQARLNSGVHSAPARISNISEGGALVLTQASLEHGEAVQLKFSILGKSFALQGRVAHRLPQSYGIQFILARDSRVRVRKLMRALELMDLKKREFELHSGQFGSPRTVFRPMLKDDRGRRARRTAGMEKPIRQEELVFVSNAVGETYGE